MSDEPALLAAIRAHPNEDTPRLMYADWLDENGRPELAEFIRIQCAPDADEAAEEYAAELEERNRGRWLRELGVPQFPGANWGFRRGFPEYLDAPSPLFLERYEAFARVPWLRFLTLQDVDNSSVRDFLNRTWPPQWVEVELQEDWSSYADVSYDATPTAVALANCPQVRRLRRLELWAYTYTTAARQALASLREELGDRLVIG